MHAGLLEGQADDYDLHEPAQQLPMHYPTTNSEAAAFFLRSLMIDVMPENREPIPPFEDYPPDPIFCFFKNYAEQSHQPAASIQSFWPSASYEMFNQREQSNSLQLQVVQEGVKIEPCSQPQLKLEEIDPSESQRKVVGGITYAERREKINRYLEKRRRRSFAKKVAYDCRKKVADQRIRVKGRFVTRKQALKILQLPEGDYSEDLIKRMLLEKLSGMKSIEGHN